MTTNRGLSRRDFLKWGGAGVAGATLFGAAACGGGQESEGAGAAGLASRGDIHIEFVTHGPSADPFWSIVKSGVDQAQKDMGVQVNYRNPESFDIPEIQQIFESSIAANPDAIAATVADANALGPKVREAVNKGIPVVMLNAGLEVWQELGALNYVGQTEFEAGVEAGKRLADAGVTKALCINQEQGVATLDQRCDGFDKGVGGSVKQIAVDGSDPTAAENGVKSALRQNPDADGMLTLGPAGSDPALKALKASGKEGSIKFGTFDLSPSILKAVRDGEMLFAIDQQPYLQGYLPVVFLTNYVQYRLNPVGVIPTGPAFVTKEDAETVIKLSEEGVR
jgi:simple sugar transport system substrate-binding protein